MGILVLRHQQKDGMRKEVVLFGLILITVTTQQFKHQQHEQKITYVLCFLVNVLSAPVKATSYHHCYNHTQKNYPAKYLIIIGRNIFLINENK